jgi:aspartyl-tRNA(Asn)/glutamyl-tRNA(Gln) amidotransferase subunit B
MFHSGESAAKIASLRGLRIDRGGMQVAQIVREVLETNPEQVKAYHEGKEAVLNWLLGQVLKRARGKVDPKKAQMELIDQLKT